MIETWKDIKDYEGLYQVSNLGRVRSLGIDKYHKGRILSPNKTTGGYLEVQLSKDKKRRPFLIHRLVATTFIPNPLNLPQVNHKDENKENNCFENLEWCTQKYNANYGTRNERCAEKCSKTVYQYSLSGNFIRGWKSATEVQNQLGYKKSNISACCLNRPTFKTAYGYKWSFDNLNKYFEEKLF